ncbi:MAG: AAA family ATPase [Bacteroidia bacterium]|nr:AAA family ATPase [Bacteroidia bacterium]
MKNRRIADFVVKCSTSKTGRIIVLTGARQTGKTTLARKLFPDYEYLSVEDPVMRSQYLQLAASQWKTLYPRAILDEVQKGPTLIESIQSVYDQWIEPKYILLGSSQLLLLEKVKESLAGRCIIIEIFPLTLPELRTQSWDEQIDDSLFQRELKNVPAEIYLPSFLMDKKMVEKQNAWEHYLKVGAYPAVSDETLSLEEKYLWLQNYVRTYLERDLRDLASFRDLEPFVKLQRFLAINTGTLVNAAAIANRMGLSSKTIQRYIRYFEISYQAILLPAWSQNANKRLAKMPKIHYLDNGIIQAVLQKRNGLTGNEFESLVIAEIYKQIQTIGIQAQLYHLRTHDGKEVDLLIEMPDYYFAVEIKMTDKVTKADAKHLIGLENILNKPIKMAFILSNDRETKFFDEKIVAMNVTMFLG